MYSKVYICFARKPLKLAVNFVKIITFYSTCWTYWSVFLLFYIWGVTEQNPIDQVLKWALLPYMEHFLVRIWNSRNKTLDGVELTGLGLPRWTEMQKSTVFNMIIVCTFTDQAWKAWLATVDYFCGKCHFIL